MPMLIKDIFEVLARVLKQVSDDSKTKIFKAIKPNSKLLFFFFVLF